MALVADHDEVAAVLLRLPDDQLRRVPGPDVHLELDPFLRGVLPSLPGEPLEEDVLLALDLVDLADRRSVGRQPSLDRERFQSGARQLRQLDRLLQRLLAAGAAVDRHEDSLERHYSRPRW